MAIYKLVFPAIVYVKAQTENKAKKAGASKAGFDYFTTYQSNDCLSVKAVQTMKECPVCKFYIIRKEQDKCYHCK